jgi:molybdopterin-guanine dinucleotide biosynthesis protein A
MSAPSPTGSHGEARARDAPAFDAIVLAGGRSTRLGGRAKAELVIGGARLVDRAVVAASAAGAGRTVIVGPDSLEVPGALISREDPPFGGPVAAIAAGLAALGPLAAGEQCGERREQQRGLARAAIAPAPWVLVLSCDLVRPAAVVAALLEAMSRAARPRAARPGAVAPGTGLAAVRPGDASGPPAEASGLHLDDGRPQWLAAIYRRDALAAALDALGDPTDASMRALVGSLHLIAVADPDGLSADVDTWQDVGDARRTLEEDRMTNAPLAPEALDDWLAAVAAELGVDPGAVSIPTVLDLARDVAHGVARPAAPLTAFVVGLAAGAGLGSADELAARAAALAAQWAGAGED